MKKSLIALAALAATGAFAQSSVTLYGVADLSLTRTAPSGGTATTGLSNDGLINDGASRVGLRGVEDLGGGMKASFNYEQFINLENGQSKTDTAAASLWHRAAWMSLSGGFGDLRLGRTLSPNFYGVASWEVTGLANYSTLANKFGFAGPSRFNSHIAYTTPNFGGFSASLGTTLKDDNGGNKAIAANAVYANGPLAVGLSYSKVDPAQDSKGLGAKYSFGPVTVSAAYMDPVGDVKGIDLGVGVNLGPVYTTFTMSRDTGSAVKTTDFALVANYPLSKRTKAYAAFYRGQNGSTGTAVSTNSFGLGIRHNF